MRNIVLISIDSLRSDHCSFMGYEKETTPNIDQLARKGVVFDNAIAPGPATPQSVPAIFTGYHPHEHVDSDKFDTRTSIKAHLNRSRTIPERLNELGYVTAGFSPNPFTSRYYGFDNGFDEYHDFLGDDPLSSRLRSRIVTRWIRNEPVAGTRFLINMLGFGDISMTWESYYESVLEWVEEAEKPYFLWLFLLEPHWPYNPPRQYRRHSLWSLYRANWQRAPATRTSPTSAYTDVLLDLYDGGIQHADELVGSLGSDLPGDPAIIVHADHGEEFGEHGNYGHSQLYEETIHVPFIIGNIDHSQSISSLISLSSMSDIICSLAQGNNDWLDIDTPFAIVRKTNDQVAIRSKRWKFIKYGGSELYDLYSDQNESENIVDVKPKIAKILDQLVSQDQEALVERERISAAIPNFTSNRPL